MFSCTKCDAQSPKWAGRCDVCGGWGTFSESSGSSPPLQGGVRGGVGRKAAPAPSARLFDLKNAKPAPRVSSGDAEVDRVLGGGTVPGSIILLSGEPGVGKSTLVASLASRASGNVLYISGEESAPQLAERFLRLKARADHIKTLELFPVETLLATIEKEMPSLVLVDSIQTITSDELDSAAGTPAMIRYATSLFLELAKRSNITIVLVGQVTKDGSVAGPKTLEHLVDVVLSLEGDASHIYRLLRATKNRFGATGEVGVFEMTQEGLKAVANPSAKFLEERADVPGSVITAVIEGSRVFLVEVQALVEKTGFGMPIRRASGFDQNRLQMLCAILSKRAGLRIGDQDVYINVVGGLEIKEPAADLAVCAAIVSAHKGTPQPATLYVGEVGLGGEVRSVPLLEKRLKEAERLGVKNTVTPKTLKHVKTLL